MGLEQEFGAGEGTGFNSSNSENSTNPSVVKVIIAHPPKRGPAGATERDLGIKGAPILSFLLHAGDVRLLEHSIEVHDRSARMHVWIGGVDVTPGLSRSDEAPSVATTPTPVTSIHDPEVAVLRRQLEEQRALVRQAEQQAEAARRFLELILGEIESAHETHKKIREQIEAAGAKSFNHTNTLQDQAMQHALGQLRQLQEVEQVNVNKLKDLVKGTADTLALSDELQRRIRESLKPQTWKETIVAVKELGQAVVAGPVGLIGQGYIQSLLMARRGQQVDTAEVLDMMSLGGQQIRSRFVQLRTVLLTLPPHQATQAAAVAADFLDGQVAIEALRHFFHAATQPRETVRQG